MITINTTITIPFIIIIIITRPKPAYGRHGLVGSLGQDTDRAGTFWGVLNVSLRASGTQLGFEPTWTVKSTWNHEDQTWNHKKIHEKLPGTMRNQPGILKKP